MEPSITEYRYKVGDEVNTPIPNRKAVIINIYEDLEIVDICYEDSIDVYLYNISDISLPKNQTVLDIINGL